MVDGFVAKACAGVADVEDHGATGADAGDLDDLLGIEGGAMLHGIEEDFAEGLHHFLAYVDWELGAEFPGKGEEPVGGDESAVDADGDPAWACRENVDVVAPLAVGRGAPGEVGDLEVFERRGETGEDSGAKCGDDIVGSAGFGEDDALDAGTDATHLMKESEVFFDDAFGIGDDDAEGATAQAEESIGVSVGVFKREECGSQGAADVTAYRIVAFDDQDSAHGGGSEKLGMILDHCLCGPLVAGGVPAIRFRIDQVSNRSRYLMRRTSLPCSL